MTRACQVGVQAVHLHAPERWRVPLALSFRLERGKVAEQVDVCWMAERDMQTCLVYKINKITLGPPTTCSDSERPLKS